MSHPEEVPKVWKQIEIKVREELIEDRGKLESMVIEKIKIRDEFKERGGRENLESIVHEKIKIRDELKEKEGHGNLESMLLEMQNNRQSELKKVQVNFPF